MHRGRTPYFPFHSVTPSCANLSTPNLPKRTVEKRWNCKDLSVWKKKKKRRNTQIDLGWWGEKNLSSEKKTQRRASPSCWLMLPLADVWHVLENICNHILHLVHRLRPKYWCQPWVYLHTNTHEIFLILKAFQRTNAFDREHWGAPFLNRCALREPRVQWGLTFSLF